MAGPICLRTCRLTVAALVLVAMGVAPASAQEPRFILPALGEEEAAPRRFPDVPFSPLTPREPTGDVQESPVKTAAYTAPAGKTSIENERIKHAVASAGSFEAEIKQAACLACGSGRLNGCGDGNGCSACGSGPRPRCAPGHDPGCRACPSCTDCVDRFFSGLYECLCCPDPCYDPRWIPLADAAFHVPAARPKTQVRFRWNAGLNVTLPDRAEFFWARADGNGGGPRPAAGALLASNRIRYNDGLLYFEGAADRIGLIVETPYRSMDPVGVPHAAGFGDLRVGVKTLLFDCELLQVAAQFMTFVPTGNESKGLGVGHVSLEPSLLLGLKLANKTYLQTQVAEWIPVDGDNAYAGAILHTHTSLNQMIYRHGRGDVTVIATAEFNTWSFQDGAYTDPVFGSFQRAGGAAYWTLGPGLRIFLCDRCDIGFAASFAINTPNFAEQLYTTEFRLRF